MLILQCWSMPITLSTLITKGNSEGRAAEERTNIKTPQLCQSCSEHILTLTLAAQAHMWKHWRMVRVKRDIFSPTATWFWQLSHSNFYMVEVFSLQASLHIIRENKLFFTNTQVTTQPQSMTRAKPCPECTAHVAQLTISNQCHPSELALLLWQPPGPQRGDLSSMPLHALPSEWFLVSITQAMDNSSGTLTGKNAAWLYQLSYQRNGGVRG